MSGWENLLKGIAFDVSGALNFNSEDPPEKLAEGCRVALYNWTIQMLHQGHFGEPLSSMSKTRPVWSSYTDALEAWQEALEYWEAKCQ